VGDLKWCGPDGNECLAEANADKASVLQKYFSLVYTIETDGEFDSLCEKTSECHSAMCDLIITQEDIDKKLCNLETDKSHGLDFIHLRVLFEMLGVLMYSLFLIYNKSLQSRVLPSKWKLAEVMAICNKVKVR